MLDEDNETVDEAVATDTDAAQESSVEAVADTPEPMEAADVTPVDAEETIDVPDVLDWNGEMEALREADWVQNLDPGMRRAVLDGIEGKYQNWQRGYTNKYQDLARQRRSAEDLMKEVREQEVKDCPSIRTSDAPT